MKDFMEMKPKMIRVFHPVGQGAFYSERHFFDDNEFTIVYDCGSAAPKKVMLEKKIKSVFSKNHEIDILFISHFHADHINGIETLMNHCTIKKVVLPLLDNDAKILVKAINRVVCNNSYAELIDNPSGFFDPETAVIEIEPAVIDQNSDGVNLNDSTDISTATKNSFKSGTVFTAGAGIKWYFIPFNYKQPERKEQFLSTLEKRGLALNNLRTIAEINSNRSKIKKAYNDVDGDINENSLVLFSGKKEKEEMKCYQYPPVLPFILSWSHCCASHSACLYMGDVDLTKPELVKDLRLKLQSVISSIETVQVPHHGSIKNFDKSILFNKGCCAVFSFGKTNTYGHPSDKVICDVLVNGAYPYFVTEDQNSIVVQWV